MLESKWATWKENVPLASVASEDSQQPGHPYNPIMCVLESSCVTSDLIGLCVSTS